MYSPSEFIITVLAILQISVIIFGGFKFFASMTARLERVEEQYKPNGGSSMRDAINRIEVKLSKLEGKFEQHVEESDS
jgi:hypothetical protein